MPDTAADTQTQAGSNTASRAIPRKLYFTIGEVAELCAVKAHVLRYWEQEFPQLKPVKRRNRRYYRREDVLLIRQIQTLLHAEGYTISGARQKLSAQRKAGIEADATQTGSGNVPPQLNKEMVRELREELEEMLSLLD